MSEPANPAINAADEQTALLRALVLLQAEALLRAVPTLGTPRPRNIETLLHASGLTHGQIGAILGKTRQAVDQAVDKPLRG